MKEGEFYLWQSVLRAALLDATDDRPMDIKIADVNYILDGSRDFREVCVLAGQDPDWLRERFERGDICSDTLRTSGSDNRRAIPLRAKLVTWLRRQNRPLTVLDISKGMGCPRLDARAATIMAMMTGSVKIAGHRDYVTTYEAT